MEDKSERLEQWAEIIRKLIVRAELRSNSAFSSNHFAGHGPPTAREVRERVKSEPQLEVIDAAESVGVEREQ